MSARFDVLVVGGNADGLIAAARLAVAGHRVAVVEAQMKLGGELRTESFLTPNRYNLGQGLFMTNPPAPVRSVQPEIPLALLSANEPPFLLHASRAQLRQQLPRADRQAFDSLTETGRRLESAALAWFSGLPPETNGFGDELRSMSRLSVKDLLDTHSVGDERFRCALTYLVLAFGYDIAAPGSAGIAAYLLHGIGHARFIDGGSGVLAAELSDAIARRDGEFFESATIAEIERRDNRVAHVALADGRVIEARHVVYADNRQRAGATPFKERALGLCRVFVGTRTGEPGFRFTGSDAADVNRAYMVASGFSGEDAIYEYVAAAAAGQPTRVAGHVIASDFTRPVSTGGVLGAHSGQLWCVACHTGDIAALNREPTAQPRGTEMRPVAAALTWQSVMPLKPSLTDRDAFRRAYQEACIDHLAGLIDGFEPDDVVFEITWLPDEVNEPLIDTNLPALMASGAAAQHQATGDRHILVNPFHRLAMLTGMASGTALASLVSERLGNT